MKQYCEKASTLWQQLHNGGRICGMGEPVKWEIMFMLVTVMWGRVHPFLFDSNSTSIRAFSHYQDIYLDTLISANMKGYLFRHFNKC